MHLSDTDLTLAAASCRTVAEARKNAAEKEIDPAARAVANQESVSLSELAERFEKARVMNVLPQSSEE